MGLTKEERICPICGQDNNCQHDQGSCWCETVKVPKHILDMVPEDKKGKVCVCKSCIEKYSIKKEEPLMYDTKIENFKIRFANIDDVPLILRFIKELADYEKLLHEVVATEEILRESLFEKKTAEVIIGEYNNEPVAFALFFHNFSTFLGRPGIYLEDLYVTPEMRGKGIGKTLLSFLAKLAVDRNCGRFEWWCIDWNEPSIKFYKHLGAKPMDEWTVYRVDGEALVNLGKEFSE